MIATKAGVVVNLAGNVSGTIRRPAGAGLPGRQAAREDLIIFGHRRRDTPAEFAAPRSGGIWPHGTRGLTHA